MQTITFVTSNPDKATEVACILTEFHLATQAFEIPEIQSFSLEEIVRAKVEHAYRVLKRPVIVEDVSFHVGALKGFPGPFVKFWEQHVGYDIVVEMAKDFGDDNAAALCGVGYSDGVNLLYTESVLNGNLVTRREGEGFGFDFYFVPEGYSQTFSEMGITQKNKISHRKLALTAMREKLSELKII